MKALQLAAHAEQAALAVRVARAIGQEAVIKTVGGEGNLRCRFLDMGLIPRTKVKIMKVAPMGDPIQIHLRGYDMTIRKEDAAMIELED